MNNEALYHERFTRIKNAFACEPVDRVPIIYMGSAFAPRYRGLKMSQFVTDHDAASLAAFETITDIGGFDGSMNAGGGGGVGLTAVWLSRVLLPGKELPEDSLWQIHEAEVMTKDDYDTILTTGWNAFLPTYLPKVVDMAEFNRMMAWTVANRERLFQLYKDNGLVVLNTAPLRVTIPFEALCGGRSMNQFIFDLHRIPDKVEAVMKVIMAECIAGIKAAPDYNPNSIGLGTIWVGGWRTASAMLAPKLWKRFVWPYIAEYVDAIVAKGYSPILHWDQDWTRDLGYLNDLPAKKCTLNPDGMTDVRKFRQIVGDRMSLLGDVLPAILSTGTPDDVFTYVRELIRDIGTTGLLLAPGCDAPINTKPENMKAMVAAGLEYGKVS